MSIIYRKSLKGIDEVAFKSGGLPLRLVSYLLAVDGEASVDQLTARHQHLPSMQIVLQGLAEQGFLEVAGSAENVVAIGQTRVGNGASIMQRTPPADMYQAPPPYAPAPQVQPQQQPAYAPPPSFSRELDTVKANMVRDVSALLGADAAPVINKIQGCRTRDDLFATMMGIKKIITIYVDQPAAEKFCTRYMTLSN
jgi:hypothetical protein